MIYSLYDYTPYRLDIEHWLSCVEFGANPFRNIIFQLKVNNRNQTLF